MTDAPQTYAPATVASQRHLVPRHKPSPDQNQNSYSAMPSFTRILSPSPSHIVAPTPATIRAQVPLGSKCRWRAYVWGAPFVLPPISPASII